MLKIPGSFEVRTIFFNLNNSLISAKASIEKLEQKIAEYKTLFEHEERLSVLERKVKN